MGSAKYKRLWINVRSVCKKLCGAEACLGVKRSNCTNGIIWSGGMPGICEVPREGKSMFLK